MVSPLAASFADVYTHPADTTPMEALMVAYNMLHNAPTDGARIRDDGTNTSFAIVTLGDELPGLLLLRRKKVVRHNHARLVIAHSLLGDHRGYGRLWNLALLQRGGGRSSHRLTGSYTRRL